VKGLRHPSRFRRYDNDDDDDDDDDDSDGRTCRHGATSPAPRQILLSFARNDSYIVSGEMAQSVSESSDDRGIGRRETRAAGLPHDAPCLSEI